MLENINWPELSVGGLVGFFTALVVAAIYEWVRKPNLVFTIDESPNEGQRNIKGKDYRWKFINLIVENSARPWWQSWLWGNVAAENIRAWISYRDYDSSSEIVKVSARWASTKQPINDFGRPDWSSILVTSRESIPVGESASLAVVIKTDKSESVFGFNNESYLYYPEYNLPYDTLWSKPEFEIGSDKKYRVCVMVLAQGHEYRKEFILLNPKKSYTSIKLLGGEVSGCE